MVAASCQSASSAAAPATLTNAPRTAVAIPATVPAMTDPERHAAQQPADNRMPAASAVEITARVWKASGGINQSSAVLTRNAPPKNSAQTYALRHTNPATCVTYHQSARR